MSAAVAAPAGLRRHTALWVALASVAAWCAALYWISPGPIADEREHWRIIVGLSAGHWPNPGHIATPPTYHLIVAQAVKLLGPHIMVARGLNALATMAALVLFYGAARRRHGELAGAYVLLWAWNPVFFPYSALVYTEASTLLTLAAAVWYHVRGRTLLAAAALLLACLLRQNNVVWIVFFIVWRVADELDAARVDSRASFLAVGARLRRDWLRTLWPYGAVLALVAGYLLWHLSWALHPGAPNPAGFNPAQFYLFGTLLAAVWAPIWVQRARELWQRRVLPALARGWVCVLLLAPLGPLVMLYQNPHPFNWNPHYLHDQFCTLLAGSAVARCAVAIVIVVTVPLAASFIWEPRHRWAALTAWSFALLFLAPHFLVDHRYHIFPILFIHLCTRYTARQVRPLCAWTAVLTLGVVVYLALHATPHSGL
jgi:hypothetical protein